MIWCAAVSVCELWFCCIRFLYRPSLVVTAEEFPPHMVVKDVLQERTRTSDTVTRPLGAPRLGRQKYLFSGSMIQVTDLLAHSLNFRYTGSQQIPFTICYIESQRVGTLPLLNTLSPVLSSMNFKFQNVSNHD